MDFILWIKRVFFSSFIFVLLLMLFNYIVDPFNVFNSSFLKYPFQINERFVKIDYLSENHKKYNSYMFGSSRIGTTDTSAVEQYLPDSKFYNFTVSTASQYDNYQHLKYMVNHNFLIKNIYLQIDIKNFLLDNKPIAGDFLRQSHPIVVNENKYLYFLDYLTILPIDNIKNKLKINYINHSKTTKFDINGTGRWYVPWKDVMIEENQSKFIKNEESLNINRVIRKFKDKYINENVQNLKNFVQLCKENHINLIVFTTPHNYNMMDNFDLNDYYKVLISISKIVDFWDFSGYNEITCNNRNFYEKSHYLPKLGRKIAKTIFKKEKSSNYITIKTIEKHIEELRLITDCSKVEIDYKFNLRIKNDKRYN